MLPVTARSPHCLPAIVRGQRMAEAKAACEPRQRRQAPRVRPHSGNPAPQGVGVDPQAPGHLRPRQAGLLLQPRRALRRSPRGRCRCSCCDARASSDARRRPAATRRAAQRRPGALFLESAVVFTCSSGIRSSVSGDIGPAGQGRQPDPPGRGTGHSSAFVSLRRRRAGLPPSRIREVAGRTRNLPTTQFTNL